MALADHGPLKFRNSAEQSEQQVIHRAVVAREGPVLFHEAHGDGLDRERLDDPAQVVHVARQPIHAVHDQRVTIAQVVEHERHLRSAGVLSATGVCEYLVESDAVELALHVLLRARYPDVADLLAFHDDFPKFVYLESRPCHESVNVELIEPVYTQIMAVAVPPGGA